MHQNTIGKPVHFSGTGLHGGHKVTMTFLPAPPDTGILFRRTDLEGKPEIPARFENVSQTNRSTTLSKGNVKVHTVEHVLATFHGFGIDNAIVELDANEPPIGDGSARAYCAMIAESGILPQDAPREVYLITEPIEMVREETRMTVFPHDGMKISCTSTDKAGRFTQWFSVEITAESWVKELSEARTFCYYEEIEYLIKNGLIKGGSLENAVVIRDDAVLTTEPLRYAEEFVRHKILDILGDLALLGKPFRGHVSAVCPSHASNVEFARLIHAQITKPMVAAQTFTPPPPAEPAAKPAKEPEMSQDPQKDSPDDWRKSATSLDIDQLMKILPHRYPFLMVDKVTHMEGNHITAVKNVSINEQYFPGHFPNHPVMPGVLQLEAIAQVAGILMLKQAENTGKLAYFMAAESVKWRKPVRPGDILTIDVELTKTRGKIGKAKGICTVDGDIVSEGNVTFMLMDE